MDFTRFSLAKPLTCLLMMGLLSGCLSLPKADDRNPQNQAMAWEARQQQLAAMDRWKINGALAIKNDNQGGQLRFHWAQNQDQFDIDLTAPLGGMIAKVNGRPGSVTLTKPDEPAKHASSAEEIVHSELGWRFPVSHIKYWIRGLPVPGIDAKTHFDQFHHLQTLQQAGWHIEFARYTNTRGVDVPAKMILQRPPLQLKLVVTRWS